jgi:hypothetical protein
MELVWAQAQTTSGFSTMNSEQWSESWVGWELDRLKVGNRQPFPALLFRGSNET